MARKFLKKAVTGMSEASIEVMAKAGVTMDDIDVVVTHQANLRIIEAVAKPAGAPMDKVFLTVHKYGKTGVAIALVALVEAIEAGRVKPNGLVLIPAFGAGLTLSTHLIRLDDRVTPIATSDVALPPCEKSALEMVQALMKHKQLHGRSEAMLMSAQFIEAAAEL